MMSEWRKSSLSQQNGNCVEVRFAPPNECVNYTKLSEVRRDGVVVQVRDSKDTGGTELSFTLAEWRSFLTGVRGGEFDHEASQPQQLLEPVALGCCGGVCHE